ncbi:rhomboid family intramembrane serine protease [Mucilaginibacter myungsuensis]|uniref:Rhomboid family intramembrane serine protease n=1 Tax=Mucilaginibacter myungsuensis TaxID=649104 RepID=A0A929L3J7_9SPHI|nr:rhomboid family intramembrane serine protease [Mucilaginibacter myungsuensis]MBE9663824.1 rhomboid family intramembrane serine protease [Mucilaginibacter myungsuensis]MDN3598461.1 rhomboid family intramembrane serine protease [Mucilaginibacter myungsuensis]
MIQNPFANLTPVVKNLVMINIVFFVGAFALGSANVFDMDKWLAVYYPGSPNFRLWQIVSYMFMHGGLWHIAFNMFALISFGPIIEQSIGDKRFLILYFASGFGALLCQWGVQAVEIQMITGHLFVPDVDASNVATYAPYLSYGMDNATKLGGIYNGSMVGASGSVFGVLVAFAMLYPNMELIIFPLPMPIKAKFLVPGYVILELVLGVNNHSGDSVAHFAHLGGAIVGFIIIKAWGYRSNGNFF